MPPQEVWDRHGIPIESWDKSEDGTKRFPFVGIKGTHWLYVELKGETPQFYRNPGEAEAMIGSLNKDDRDAYATWVAALRDCAVSASQYAAMTRLTD